jgi:hypothetical protein
MSDFGYINVGNERRRRFLYIGKQIQIKSEKRIKNMLTGKAGFVKITLAVGRIEKVGGKAPSVEKSRKC